MFTSTATAYLARAFAELLKVLHDATVLRIVFFTCVSTNFNSTSLVHWSSVYLCLAELSLFIELQFDEILDMLKNNRKMA